MTEGICRCAEQSLADDLVGFLAKHRIPATIVDFGVLYEFRYSVRVAPDQAEAARYIRQYVWPAA